MMGRGSSLTLHDPPSDASLFEIVEDVERRVITDMLERCNWNQTEAAERFHVPLSTLNQKIRRLNIEIKKKGFLKVRLQVCLFSRVGNHRPCFSFHRLCLA
jgi:DNA-binding IscR family transcriptional regulator